MNESGRLRYPPSMAARSNFEGNLDAQEAQLAVDPIVERMKAARKAKADDPFRPLYHYVNPENTLNDPNGLCFWQGRWHMFYQARPPDDERWHWGHAVSDDLIHWRDLPYAIYPGPEQHCYSGATFVEEDRVIAMYHGTEIGNMVAVSSDPLLLNWEKVSDGAVIPFETKNGMERPYGVFDPCIWKKDGKYYALSAGTAPYGQHGQHVPHEYLFQSEDLLNWTYVHPFVEGDRFTSVGDDGACPYFWPIGDRHILLFFSHLSGGQYLIGDYDKEGDKFRADAHGLFNIGAAYPGGVHAPSAVPDGKGGVIAIFNMNPGRPTLSRNVYLQEFFGDISARDTQVSEKERTLLDWDQIMTLPRRLTLLGRDELGIEPAGDIESLRYGYVHVDQSNLPANTEVVFDAFEGNSYELVLEIDPKHASVIELYVLRSPDRQEYTKISYYHKRGRRYRSLIPNDQRALRAYCTALSTAVKSESIICLDTSCSSTLPDAICRPPAVGEVHIAPGEMLRLRVFVDKSVVEVFVNERQCLAARVYPGLAESRSISLTSRGQDASLLSADFWKMKSIY